MGYLIDPTETIYGIVSGSVKFYMSLQSWWNESLVDVHGSEVVQTKAERIEGIRDWFYAQSESTDFHNPFMAAVFDSLTDDIDWAQLESLLYEGGEDDE
jgi:hypothetical protein